MEEKNKGSMTVSKILKNHVSVMRISLMSSDYKLLDNVVEACTKAITLSGGTCKGPIRLPNRRHLTTLLASPHVYKTALEQFSMTIYKVILDVDCGVSTLSVLKELNISGGVEIKISVKKGLHNEKK